MHCEGCWSELADGGRGGAVSVRREPWRDLVAGDRVRVVRGSFPLERDLLGREFAFVRWSVPHGFAVVADEHGAWHLHPEALDVLKPGGS